MRVEPFFFNFPLEIVKLTFKIEFIFGYFLSLSFSSLGSLVNRNTFLKHIYEAHKSVGSIQKRLPEES